MIHHNIQVKQQIHPTSPAIYSSGANYQFNITWTDNIGISEVVFEFNGANYSYLEGEVTNTSNEYNVTLTDLTANPSGYSYKWYANDTDDQWGSTSTLSYVINKVTSNSSLTIPAGNGTYPHSTTTTCTEDSGEAAGNLYRNQSSATENNTAITLGANTYEYICNLSSTENYSSASTSSILTISKAPTNISLYLNGSENNASYTQNVTGNFTVLVNVSDLTVNLTSNYTGFIQQNGTTSIINYTNLSTTGNWWNLTGWTDGNANYSASSRTYYFNASSGAPAPYCGDGTCDPGETTSSCPADCGTGGTPSGGGGGISTGGGGGVSAFQITEIDNDTMDAGDVYTTTFTIINNNEFVLYNIGVTLSGLPVAWYYTLNNTHIESIDRLGGNETVELMIEIPSDVEGSYDINLTAAGQTSGGLSKSTEKIMSLHINPVSEVEEEIVEEVVEEVVEEEIPIELDYTTIGFVVIVIISIIGGLYFTEVRK